jgi:hypothetical protein
VTLGQPLFSGVGCTACDGVAEGRGVSAGLGDGVSTGVTVADGVGVGVGDALLRFDFTFGVALGDGVGEAFFSFGEAVGDGLGVALFAGCFRCLRVGVGVGVGSKIFLIFVPNASSAAPPAWPMPNNIATIK